MTGVTTSLTSSTDFPIDENAILQRRVTELERQIAELRIEMAQRVPLQVHHYPTQGAAGIGAGLTYIVPNSSAMPYVINPAAGCAPAQPLSFWTEVPPAYDPSWSVAGTASTAPR
jgi:hypothetical protein